MALVHAKSAAITNLDASPPVRNTSGEGGHGHLIYNETTIAVVGQADALSTYSLFRVPSNACLKFIDFSSPSQGATGIFNIGAYYGPDGPAGLTVTPPTVAGVSVIDEDFFAQALDTDAGTGVLAHLVPGSGFVLTNATPAQYVNDTWLASMANKRLWDALGLTVDPRCSIDIVANAVEAIATGTVSIYAAIGYVLL